MSTRMPLDTNLYIQFVVVFVFLSASFYLKSNYAVSRLDALCDQNGMNVCDRGSLNMIVLVCLVLMVNDHRWFRQSTIVITSVQSLVQCCRFGWFSLSNQEARRNICVILNPTNAVFQPKTTKIKVEKKK